MHGSPSTRFMQGAYNGEDLFKFTNTPGTTSKLRSRIGIVSSSLRDNRSPPPVPVKYTSAVLKTSDYLPSTNIFSSCAEPKKLKQKNWLDT